jgi:hypothetical protein
MHQKPGGHQSFQSSHMMMPWSKKSSRKSVKNFKVLLKLQNSTLGMQSENLWETLRSLLERIIRNLGNPKQRDRSSQEQTLCRNWKDGVTYKKETISASKRVRPGSFGLQIGIQSKSRMIDWRLWNQGVDGRREIWVSEAEWLGVAVFAC